MDTTKNTDWLMEIKLEKLSKMNRMRINNYKELEKITKEKWK